jgi:signal transduction histidine kinase
MGPGTATERGRVMGAFEEQIHLERLDWFIRLRWWALGGGLAILLLSPLLTPLELDLPGLLAVLGALGLLNFFYLWYWRRLKAAKPQGEHAERAGGVLHLQMFLDLLILTVLLYLGGGTQNPLLLLFLFHLAISAILFRESESLLYAGLAAGLPWLLHFVEFLGHRPPSPWKGSLGMGEDFQTALLWAYTLAAAGLWFFLSRLAKDLREKERGLRETGRELSEANEGLKHLDDYKNRFLKQVVLRLKKPVVDVDFDLTELSRALPARNAKAGAAVAAAKGRVWNLLGTIEDLTWLSRMRAGDEPLKKVYEALLRRVQVLEGEAAKKGISIQIHGDPAVRLPADARALAQAVDQLLSNAVKYTPPGKGPVKVEFKAEEGWLDLAVEDDGIGIPPQQQKRLFEEFFRATNAKAMEEAGTGLGLSIVKWILEAHKGTVKVVSEPGKGTRVETRWPLSS